MSHSSRHLTPSTDARVRSRATAAVALFVAASVFAGPTAVHAETPSPTPTPTETPVVTTPLLSAAAATAGVLRSGDPLRVDVRITNPTGDALAAGTATVALGSAALPSAAAVDAWLDGDTPATGFTSLTPASINAVPAGDAASVTIASTATDTAVTTLAPGTYPLTVTYASGTTTLTDRAIVTVRAAAATPVQTALVVPVTTSASSDALLSSEMLQTLTGPGGELTELLTGLSTTPQALLAVDPAIAVSIRVLGSAAPASARDWLDALQELPNERVTLQFADADVTTQFAAGLTAPLQPTSFGWALDAAAFAPEDAPAGTPTPSPTAEGDATPTAGEIVLPTTEQLLHLDSTFAAWWPANGSTDEQTIAAAGDQTKVLLSSDATGERSGHLTIGGTDVLAYDADLTEALSEAAGEADAGARAELLARASALVQFQAEANGGKPLFIGLERGTSLTSDALRDTTAALANAGATQTITAGDLLANAATPATLTDPGADAARVSDLGVMLADEQRLTAFSTVLDEPDLLLGRERARSLRLLSAAWFSTEGAAEAAQAQHARVGDILQAVELIQPTQITQVSSGSNIPMFVRNDLPFDVTVVVATTTNDVRLKVQERTEVSAPASSTQRVSIPVTASISNGEVQIALQLLSKTGFAIGPAKYADLTIRAEWERIGLGVFVALVALLLGLGTFRMIRRRRKGTDEAAPKKASRKETRAAYRTHEPSEDEERG